MLYSAFCEIDGDLDTQHWSSDYYSDRYGKVDIMGYVTENGDVFFADSRNQSPPKFCPYTGKPLTLTTQSKLP